MIKFIIIIFPSIIFLLALGIFIFTKVHPAFGGKDDKMSKERIQQSKNFNGKKFVNLNPVKLMTRNSSQKKPDKNSSIFSIIFPPKNSRPNKPLPSEKFREKNFKNNTFSWLGHSTILIKLKNKTIIVDPVFHNASPSMFFGKPFATTNQISLNELPNINIVLITHDHYDHLDYQTIRKLQNNVDQYLVPLGVKKHLQKWGVNDNKITEMDWYDSQNFAGINFNFVPSQHFSGRSLTDRNSSLWGGWTINSTDQNIYISGDTGYFAEFKKIGEKLGPFDLAFIENGAYNQAWNQIHMMPEQSIQAGIDAKGQKLVPIHWAKFDLAPHRWQEPIERFTKESKERNIDIITPMIGEIFDVNYKGKNWWE